MGAAEPTAGARTRPMSSLVRWHPIRLVGVTLLLALPGLSTAVLARAQADYYQAIVTPARDAVTHLKSDLTGSLSAYHAFLASGGVGELTAYQQARTDYFATLDRQLAGKGPLSEARVSDLRRTATDWFAAADDVIADVRAQTPADANPASAAYARAIEQSRGADDDTIRVRNDWSALHERTLTIGIAVSLAAAALAGFASCRMIRSSQRTLADPMDQLATVVGSFDSGDWSVRAPADRGSTEILAVANALNRLADSETTARAEQELSLRMLAATSEVVSELAIALSQDGHWSPACAHLGRALGVDRVVLNTWQDGTFTPLGSWASQDLPPEEFFLPAVHGPAAERLLRGVTVASTPQEIADRFPGQLAELILTRGGRAWITQPLRVADGVVGLLSVWGLRYRSWQRAELEMVERCAFAAAATVADARRLSRLQDLEEEKSAFLATTSHELRTPLTSISGYVELLSEGEFGDVDPDQAHALAVVERNVRRLRALVDDLLILSGLDSGRAITTRERVPVDAVVRDALAEVTEEARAEAIRIDYPGVDYPLARPELAAVDVAATVGVYDQLVRALRCVLGNAVKFSSAGDVVRVGVDVDGGDVIVSCRDEGIGIPAGELDRVFARFYRASNAAREEVQGTGLGLAITKSVVEAHGGNVGVESVEGQGTTVTVRLPLAAPVAGAVGS